MIRIEKYTNIDRGANPDNEYYIDQDGTRLSLTKVELEKIACDLNLLGIADVVGQSEQLPPKCIEGFDDDKFCDNSNECEWCKGLIRR